MKRVSEELLATVPDVNWHPLPAGNAIQEKWLPLFITPQTNSSIGLAPDGKWLSIAESGHARELTTRFNVELLILLEMPLAEATTLITSGVEKNGLPTDITQVIIDATIYSGLAGPSDHWQNLALDWLLESGRADDDILAALEKVVTDGRTQQVRHKARRILKSFYKRDI